MYGDGVYDYFQEIRDFGIYGFYSVDNRGVMCYDEFEPVKASCGFLPSVKGEWYKLGRIEALAGDWEDSLVQLAPEGLYWKRQDGYWVKL